MHSSVSPHDVGMGVGGAPLLPFCFRRLVALGGGADQERSMNEAGDVHRSWIVQSPEIPLSNLGLS